MRARLKILTSDHAPALRRYVPPAADEFAVPLALEIGPIGVVGRKRFELLVVTPKWLLKRHGKRGLVVGRGKLLAFEWDFDRIRAYLHREVERCSAESWPELARKGARIGAWV